MSRLFFWSALALLLATTANGQVDPGFRDLEKRLVDLQFRPLVDAWLQEVTAPGGVIVLVEGDRRTLLESFGVAHLDGRLPVEASTTLFRVGDLARLMTATAALRLVDEEILSLDEDLTDRAALQFLDLDGLDPLTLSQLLLHTAGFDQRSVATRSRTPEGVEPLAGYLRRRMPRRIRPPGRVSLPSSHGYSLAGLLIESVTGKDFTTAVDDWVFTPFGMRHSSVDPHLPATRKLATGYTKTGAGLEAVEIDYSRTFPASSLLTTAADMGRWLQVVLAGDSSADSSLLTPASRQRLLSAAFRHHPSLPGRTLALREGSRYSPPELYMASRGRGFSSLVMLLPGNRTGLFAAVNCEEELWSLAYAILDALEPGRALPAHQPDVLPPADSGNLTGYWQDAAVSLSTPEKLLSLIRQDRLSELPDGGLRWRSRLWRRVSDDEYRSATGGERLCFFGDRERPRLAATPQAVYERLGWHHSRPVQALLWVLFAAIFLASCWPRPSLPRRLSALSPADAHRPRWPATVVRYAAATHFLFISTLALLLASSLRWQVPALAYGIPLPVRLALALPLVGAVLTPAAVVGTALAWRSPQWSRRRRLLLTFSTMALVLFLPFLWDWNLLGFRL